MITVNNKSPFAQAALEYVKRGWPVFPLDGKKPYAHTHGFKDATLDEAKIKKWLTNKRYANANVGIPTGKKTFVSVDCDSEEARKHFIELCGGEEPRTMLIQTRPHRYQYWFESPDTPLPSTASKVAKAIDTRGEGGYVCAPPSIHPKTGKPYTVIHEAELAPLPEIILEKARKKESKGTSGGFSLPEVIPESERQTTLFKFGCSLRAKGYDMDDIDNELQRVHDDRCDPTWTAEEIRKEWHHLLQRVESYDENAWAAAMERMNKRHALVRVANTVGILDTTEYEERGTLIVQTKAAFDQWYANQRLPDQTIGKKIVQGRTLSKYWFDNVRRRQYERLEFAPGEDLGKGAYNLWRGFAYDPWEGSNPEQYCGRYLRHLYDHVAQGNDEIYDKVLALFAHMFQCPQGKEVLGVSLVLRGDPGVGKSIVGEVIGELLHPHYLSVAQQRHLVGNFNSHLAGKLMLQADEAFWAGDKAAEGVLKDLITGKWMNVEMKGREVIRVRNFIRLLLTTNARWAVPVAIKDRRFMVVDVINPEHCGSRDYFGAMVKELADEDGRGYRALLAHLLSYDWEAARPDVIPMTSALGEQKEEYLSMELKFLLRLAHRGWLPQDFKGEGETVYQALESAYLEFARARIRHVDSNWLTRRVNEFLNDNGLEPLKKFWRQVSLRAFPALAELRAAFEKTLGSVDWEADTADTESGWHRSPADEI